MDPIPWLPTRKGPKYLPRTLYIHEGLAGHLRGLAESESWELADLARGMILVGLALRHLYEAESELGSMEGLINATNALNYFVHRAVRRRYSRRRRGGGCGVWITVHLPAGFVEHVDRYARGHARSRNDALAMFLQDGLYCYLLGYTRFLKGSMKNLEHEAAG